MNAAHDAVILAAGGSRRLGRPKQLLTVAGETLVARVARLVLTTRPSRTLVIVGAHAEAVSAALEGLGVEVVTNREWSTGMASSLRAAASALEGRDLPVLVTVIDQPALEARHLDALLAAHRDDGDTATAYGDAVGVPAVLRASTLARAAELQGDSGFRHLWAEATPRTVRADELAADLDNAADVDRAVAAGRLDRAAGRLVYRHRWPVRVMHWINVVCLCVLLGSGLQIFNAHPALYWGQRSDPGKSILSLEGGTDAQGNPRGTTRVGGLAFDTTGVLGASKVNGEWAARGFPAWATIPGPGWLAMGRRWHFFFAWLFVANGLAYVGWSVVSRHLTRDLLPTRSDWRGIGRSIVDHLRFRHARGDEALRYNVLQRIAYLIVIFLFGGGIVLMGIAMSPRMDAVLHWLVDIVGGRQSARTIHFVIAIGFVVFVIVHVFEVLVSRPLNQLRAMITGWYRHD